MRLKVFLDTTFLMPLFGLEPDLKNLVKDFDPLWSLLDLEFYYSSFSIMELKYIFIKVAKTSENAPVLEKQFSSALNYLKKSSRLKNVPFLEGKLNDTAFELRRQGHPDIFDRIIVASAIHYSDYFLTQDKPLTKLCTSLITQKKYPSIEIGNLKLNT